MTELTQVQRAAILHIARYANPPAALLTHTARELVALGLASAPNGLDPTFTGCRLTAAGGVVARLLGEATRHEVDTQAGVTP